MRRALRGRRVSAGSPQKRVDVSRTPVVRTLGALQALVVVATTLCLVAFASVSWLGALLVAVVLSLAVNLAMARFASHDERDSAHVPLSGRHVPPLRSGRKYFSMSRVSR